MKKSVRSINEEKIKDCYSIVSKLAGVLFEEEAVCSSLDEASTIANAIEHDLQQQLESCIEEKLTQKESSKQYTEEYQESLENLLIDYLDVEEDQAKRIIRSTIFDEASDKQKLKTEDRSQNEEEVHDESLFDEEEDSNDDDGEWIGEGECELCERFIRLTKHHLIPRSTWPRFEKRIANAVYHAIEKNDEHRARLIIGDGLDHILSAVKGIDSNSSRGRNSTISSKSIRRAIQQALQQTCSICRQCHNTVHSSHDNITLATTYNTVDKLLEDERIYKFAKWASKQRAGKYKI